MHLGKILALSQRLLTITHTMTLQIGLSHDIETCRVTQVIPAGVVRIVRRTHGIDVQLLHDANVLTHAVDTHHIAAIRVELMSVDTFY